MYTLGFLFRNKFLSIPSIKTQNKVFILIICFLVVCIILQINGLVAVVNNSYGNLMYYLYCAICGTVLLLITGFFLPKSKLLLFIGKNSLIIFGLHTIFIVFYSKTLSKYYNKTIVCQNNLSIIQIIIGFILITFIMLLLTYVFFKIKECFVMKRSK